MLIALSEGRSTENMPEKIPGAVSLPVFTVFAARSLRDILMKKLLASLSINFRISLSMRGLPNTGYHKLTCGSPSVSRRSRLFFHAWKICLVPCFQDQHLQRARCFRLSPARKMLHLFGAQSKIFLDGAEDSGGSLAYHLLRNSASFLLISAPMAFGSGGCFGNFFPCPRQRGCFPEKQIMPI